MLQDCVDCRPRVAEETADKQANGAIPLSSRVGTSKAVGPTASNAAPTQACTLPHHSESAATIAQAQDSADSVRTCQLQYSSLHPVMDCYPLSRSVLAHVLLMSAFVWFVNTNRGQGIPPTRKT